MRVFLQFRNDRPGAWKLARGIGISVAVGVAYFLAAQLSFGLRIPPNVICWPAAGISAGVLIWLWPIARWPVVAGMMVATVVVNLLHHFSIAATAAWVVGNTAEPLIIAGLIHYYFGANFKIDQVHCVLGLAAAAVVGTIIAATWWTAVYYWFFALKAPATAWSRWIISDLAGILSVTPLVIGLAAALRQSPSPREVVESISALAVLGALTAGVILLPAKAWETVTPAALVFPLLLWLATRCQPVFAAAGAFIVSMMVALTAIYGVGHFGDPNLSVDARALQTQAIILAVSFGTAVLAALFCERRESEARLAHSNMMLKRERDQKLLNAQAITASIAHEIRQPLTAIVASGEAALIYLGKIPPDVESGQTSVERVITASSRVSTVLDSMRALFRKGGEKRERVDLNAIVLEVLQLLGRELQTHRIEVRTELESDLPLVVANKGQLQEVLINVASNAIEAMATTTDRDRTLRVSTRCNGRDNISVAVRDSGPGIDPRKIDGVFNAFVTTKAQGTGLGLAICRMIIQQHGGELTASSDGKSGALFQFDLPIKRTNQNTAETLLEAST